MEKVVSMEKRIVSKSSPRPASKMSDAATKNEQKTQKKRMKKLSEYGKQLQEKQKVKEMYGMREAQFKRFFHMAIRSEMATGESLLSLLERRLDNVLFRLKLAVSRIQARQAIVHGLVTVNGKKVYSPSYLVAINDEIAYIPKVLEKKIFLEQVVDKRLNTGVKTPEWVEINKNDRKGRILRYPVRSDVTTPIEEHLIVELYSK
jgi:small subunit ribosomal protein S4